MNKFNILIVALALIISHQAIAADYTVAVRAHRGIESAIKKWQPTLDYLSNESGKDKFTLLPILSLTEITNRAGQAEFDFLLTNPSSHVEVVVLHQSLTLATLNNKRSNTAQDRYGSVIFTHASNSKITKISDLKNKKLMVVSKYAFGGWRVAWLEMLDNGFNPMKDLGEILYSKSKTQPEVVYAVLGGLVDVGVVRTDLLERLVAKGKIDMRYFRVINNKDIDGFPFFLSTKLYPEWAFSALKHVPKDTAGRVKDSLLAIKQKSVAAKKGNYIGWVEPGDYDVVKSLMKKLSVGPYSN